MYEPNVKTISLFTIVHQFYLFTNKALQIRLILGNASFMYILMSLLCL